MNNNDKSVWDGVILVASYHFLLAVVCLLGAAATVVFAIIPNLATASTNPQAVFMPVIGAIFGLVLCIWYASIGSGLIRLKNSSRMGAVFLALFGSIGGLFLLLGAGIPVINSLLPDVGAVTGVAVAAICGYSLMTFLDIIVLIFLYSGRVRAVFYGEPWSPENANVPGLGTLVRAAIFGVPVSSTTPIMPVPTAPAPIAPVASQSAPTAPHRETPPPPPVDDLDTPGDLFTEPAPRKR
ncbi:hypothetical protein [Leptolinea tardivitalis]|uniref:Uncharacterized protein n=1 Tax=Leptolinea tardivitalis TaxID=229920 RepID=A0A0P6XKA3_9CHLR|nr:hypothetical protein [Leptolinea tardivitalis]KPL71901.1 hypothetical protein ADM99_10895 [Leptolinea tardivitalis]GAP20312.1 hypothetical protein LTAR_00500 [Leptolinea tardivitalis]